YPFAGIAIPPAIMTTNSVIFYNIVAASFLSPRPSFTADRTTGFVRIRQAFKTRRARILIKLLNNIILWKNHYNRLQEP
ncbi:MAG: hypothetical protein EB127_23940, partial [Alphaproteobacteria bacterium]|nr:hypothetical protein [Alphaproteobacteria bacterium]